MTLLTSDSKTNIDIVKKASRECFPDNDILADLTAAQAILESRLNGNPSELALKYCNLFGIKGEGTHQPQRSIGLMTHEYYGGAMHAVQQPFAWNDSVEDSFEQHKHLFELRRYANLATATTFEDAARMIREDGYATDPNYPDELIETRNRYLI
jgi:lysozyme